MRLGARRAPRAHADARSPPFLRCVFARSTVLSDGAESIQAVLKDAAFEPCFSGEVHAGSVLKVVSYIQLAKDGKPCVVFSRRLHALRCARCAA